MPCIHPRGWSLVATPVFFFLPPLPDLDAAAAAFYMPPFVPSAIPAAAAAAPNTAGFASSGFASVAAFFDSSSSLPPLRCPPCPGLGYLPPPHTTHTHTHGTPTYKSELHGS